MALYTPQQQSSIDAVLKARRNDASIPGGMTPEQMGVPAKPTQTPGVVPTGNVPMGADTAPPPPNPPTNPKVQGFTDFQKQQGDLMGKLESYMQPMKYDPNTDPSYLAYKQLASAQAKDASGAAMETLNSRGILNSSITRDDVAGIEQKYAAQAAAQIPILQQQAYNQNRDRVADVFKLLSNSQDQQQRSVDNANSDRNFGINEAQLTGNYTNPNSEAVKQQMAANSAAYGSASPEEQQRLHDENIKLAASIGGKDTTGNGDYEFTPQRTIQGQQLDLNQKIDDRNFQYQTVQDAIKNGMSQQQIDNQASQFAAQMGYNYDNMNANDRQAWAQIAISQQNANTSSSNAAWARDPNNPDNVYKSAQIQELTNKGDQKLQDESKGLVEALRGGQMTPGAAIQQIDQDVKLGFYTPQEASHLKSIITTLSPNLPTPANQQQLTPEQQSAIPSDAELDKLYKTEGNGAPILDWKSWYKDPKGKPAGVDFATWKQLYGPTIRAK